MINFKINGIPVQVEEGTTILEAAKKANIKIPTLCYNPDLPAWASCGLCIVRMAGSPNWCAPVLRRLTAAWKGKR